MATAGPAVLNRRLSSVPDQAGRAGERKTEAAYREGPVFFHDGRRRRSQYARLLPLGTRSVECGVLQTKNLRYLFCIPFVSPSCFFEASCLRAKSLHTCLIILISSICSCHFHSLVQLLVLKRTSRQAGSQSKRFSRLLSDDHIWFRFFR